MCDYIYILFVFWFDYTYIDRYIDIRAYGIKSFLALQVWSQAIAGARTIRPQFLARHDNHSAKVTFLY